jgi:Aerotolerance regulator N-terminal/von Willebrand factor type A domain
MSFLTPWMLWGMAAVSAPILIHLRQRRQVVTVRFSTLRFLRIAATKTRRSAILENLLLLLLRCLLFALLIIAAARPVLPSKMAKMLGGSVPRTVVIAIDNSMSMGCLVNGTPRLEFSKKQALTVLDDLKDNDEVAVIAAAGSPRLLIPKPTLDHKIARKMIEAIRGTEERSELPPLFRETRKILENEGDRVREFYLFTDAQETAWRFHAKGIFDAAWDSLNIHTVIVTPDDLAPPNRAVSSVKITSPIVFPGGLLSGVAVVENHSDTPLHDVVEFRVEGERVAQLPVDVPAHGGTELKFEGRMPPVRGRWAGGVATIQSDNLTPDDSFFFAMPVAQRARVLVVEGQQPGEEMLRSGYYLRKALQFGEVGQASAPPESVSPAGLDDMALDAYSTIFLADVGSLSDRALVRLQRFLQGGGTVVFFPGDLSVLSSLEKFDFLPALPTGMMDLPAGRLATLISEPNHPLVSKIWDRASPFPALPLKKLMRWKLRQGSKMLLAFSNGEPFVVVKPVGAGACLLVNAAADRSWGDFPLSPSFLPLVQQIARLSGDRGAGESAILVGNAIPMTPNLPQDQSLTLRTPDGSVLPIAPGEKSSLLDHAEHPGIYRIDSSKEGTLQLFAVNADRIESDLRPLSKQRLLETVPSEVVTGTDGLRLWLTQSKGNKPLWPALLLLALLVFTLESTLSNHLARSRSQGNDTSIKTGRLNKRRFGAVFRPGSAEASS